MFTMRSMRTRWATSLQLVAAASISAVSVVGAQDGSCTAGERREALRELQRQALEFAPQQLESLDPAIQPGGLLAGWRLTHGHVVMAHSGAVPVATSSLTKHPLPQVLQYAPSAESDPSEWLDFSDGDGPYRLIGWGYLAPYDPAGPPSLPCIPASDWFVHEAGWHLMDGGMRVTPDAVIEPPRPNPASEIFFWHPKVWDLHVWIGEGDVPIVSFANPNAPGGGLHLPDGVSYSVVNGEKRLP